MESPGTDKGPIKGMIRHRETEQFYQGNGKWTADLHQAMQFENLAEVVEEAKRHNLNHCCEFVVQVNGQIGFRVLLPL
jgi:hypothetical protein